MLSFGDERCTSTSSSALCSLSVEMVIGNSQIDYHVRFARFACLRIVGCERTGHIPFHLSPSFPPKKFFIAYNGGICTYTGIAPNLFDYFVGNTLAGRSRLSEMVKRIERLRTTFLRSVELVQFYV